jgi:RHS repeat-associated protein
MNPFRYTGRDFDSETGLQYHRARYYSPQAGRFISEDPIRFEQGSDFYSYVGNGPTTLIDPTGLAKCCPNKEEKDIQKEADSARHRIWQLEHLGTIPTENSSGKPIVTVGGMTGCMVGSVKGTNIPVIDYFVTVKVDPIKHPCIYKCFLGHEMVHARMCKKLGMKFYSLTEAQTEIPAYQWEVGCYLKLQMDAGLGPYKKEQ